MKHSKISELSFNYQNLVSSARKFEPQLTRDLIAPLESIPGVVSINWRIKSWESYLKKQTLFLETKHKDTASRNVTDVLGIRIIVDYRNRIEVVQRRLKEIFFEQKEKFYDDEIVRRNETDSVHYIIDVPESVFVPGGIQSFELQIVTAVAHAYAQAIHLYNYRVEHPVDDHEPSSTEPNYEVLPTAPEMATEALRGADRGDLQIEILLRLLDKADVHEKKDVHPFLLQHDYFLHPATGNVVNEPPIGLGTKYRIDFIIREATGEYILVEIENPRHRLFNKNGDFNSSVNHAVQQVEDWQEWIEQNISTTQKEYPDIVSPRGLVIIGRSTNLSDSERRKLARRNINTRGRIEIVTYDDLINRTRALVTGIRRHFET